MADLSTYVQESISKKPQHPIQDVALRINVNKILTALYIISISLLLINLLSIYLKSVADMRGAFVNALVYYFDAGKEQSIPTLFSSILLFTASVLLFTIFCIRSKMRKDTKGWLILTVLFVFLLLDESTAIHEQFNRLRPYVDKTSGILYYTWIIPYAVLALVVLIILWKFLFKLPTQTRNMMMLSGAIYVGAAIGFEIFEGMSSLQSGAGNLEDKLLTAGEEFLEMVGITLFIQTLFTYISRYNVYLTIPFRWNLPEGNKS